MNYDDGLILVMSAVKICIHAILQANLVNINVQY